MNLRAKELDRKIIFRGRRFAVINSKVKIRGKEVNKQFIRHKGGPEILGITKNGKVVLIESYRPELGGYSYELPGGTLKKNEKPVDAARREFEEETGYVAKKIKYMFSGYPLLGHSDSKLYFFLATDLEKRKQKLEDDESIFVKEFEPRKVFDMMKKKKIKDLCVYSAIYYYFNRKFKN